MAVCSVEWTAVVNGGKFKFKPIESCLCLVLNIQFTSQQPLVSGEMKLLPLQHFSIRLNHDSSPLIARSVSRFGDWKFVIDFVIQYFHLIFDTASGKKQR